MKQSIIRLCASFGMAAVVAATNTGCSTLPPTTSATDDCMVSTKVESKLLLAFVFTANTGEQYSLSCREGKTSAMAALVGRQANGQLHPVGAAFAIQRYKDIQDKIQNGTDSEKAFNTEAAYFYKFYLQRLGSLTIDDIRKQFDAMTAERVNAQPETTTPSSTNTAPKKCSGAGVLRSCARDLQ